MKMLTVAVCTYNRAERLPRLIGALRKQSCPIPFEILIVDNNSTDHTQEVLAGLLHEKGAKLRIIKEGKQGIVPARNRAIEESLNRTYLIFLDDDELPLPGFLDAAVDSLENEHADCVGGKVENDFQSVRRPRWLEDNLLGFLAEVNYGNKSFWITDEATPVWTANIAYNTRLFKSGLRFDKRYSRVGKDIGGGEDVVMFNELLRAGVSIRYRPDMVVKHFVEEWRLCRSYFLKLHYLSGKKTGLFELTEYPNNFFGIPERIYFNYKINIPLNVIDKLFQPFSTVLVSSFGGNVSKDISIGQL